MKKLSVSEARAKLFDLVEQVTSDPQAEVVIEHRNQKSRAVLVDAGQYRYLKATAEAVRRVNEPPFQLYGSIQLPGTPEEFDEWFEQHRREVAEASDRKFDDL